MYSIKVKNTKVRESTVMLNLKLELELEGHCKTPFQSNLSSNLTENGENLKSKQFRMSKSAKTFRHLLSQQTLKCANNIWNLNFNSTSKLAYRKSYKTFDVFNFWFLRKVPNWTLHTYYWPFQSQFHTSKEARKKRYQLKYCSLIAIIPY